MAIQHAPTRALNVFHATRLDIGKPVVTSRSAGWMLLLAGLVFGLTSLGCVRRRMTVRTTPPGATVSIDNQLIGTSPAASNFVYYGTREIRIEHDGYRTETIRRKIKPPWYQWPGLDFVSETLWPGELRDERVIDVELVPQMIEPSGDVLNRAEALRSQSGGGQLLPGVGP